MENLVHWAKDRSRMLQWLATSAVLYATAILFVSHPQLQVVLYKLGHITSAAFLGYWIDRQAFKNSRIESGTEPVLQLRRAIIIGCAMLSIALGL